MGLRNSNNKNQDLQMPWHEICPLLLILAHFFRVLIRLVTHHVILFGRVFSSIHGNACVSVKAASIGGLDFDGSRSHGLKVSCGGRRGRPRGSGGARRHFLAPPTNCVSVGVMAFPADDFGQDSSPSINEPVAYLEKIVCKKA